MSTRRKTVLIVDAQDETRDRFSVPLRRDYGGLRAGSAEAALILMNREDVDLLIADKALPGVGGLEMLQIVRENFPLAEVIMSSAEPDVDAAVSAVKLGAFHFLTKTVDP